MQLGSFESVKLKGTAGTGSNSIQYDLKVQLLTRSALKLLSPALG